MESTINYTHLIDLPYNELYESLTLVDELKREEAIQILIAGTSEDNKEETLKALISLRKIFSNTDEEGFELSEQESSLYDKLIYFINSSELYHKVFSS